MVREDLSIFRTPTQSRIEIALTDWADSGTMLRMLVIVLVLAVGIDFFMLNGKYTDAAVSLSRTILHHFRVI
jgi:hypothetical protein